MFVQPKQALIYERDDQFTAQCNAFGFPKPSVKWVSTHQSQAMNVVGTSGKLVIAKPRAKDSGTYKCIAENQAGVSYGFLFVVVIKGKDLTDLSVAL